MYAVVPVWPEIWGPARILRMSKFWLWFSTISAPLTVKALIVSKPCLRVKGWTAASLPVTNSLMNLCSSAHASYCQRLRDEQKAAEAAHRKKIESALLTEVEAEKKASKTYTSAQETLQAKESEIEQKIKEKAIVQRLLEEVQKTAQAKERELEELRQQQDKLLKKKEEEAEQVTNAVMKRAAAELTAASVVGKPLP